MIAVAAAPKLRSALPPLDTHVRKGLLREIQLLKAKMMAMSMYLAEGMKQVDALDAQLVSGEQLPVISIGQSIKLRRLALELRQDQVAAEAHLSRGQVSDLESGRRKSAEALACVLEALQRLEARHAADEKQWRN